MSNDIFTIANLQIYVDLLYWRLGVPVILACKFVQNKMMNTILNWLNNIVMAYD